MSTYDWKSLEAKWQTHWETQQTFRTLNPGDDGFDASKPKYYVLDMFPYPSGAGLHVGHPLGYIATDIIARHKRMNGFNVLHPMGFDAFGLPAEQYAVEHGVHPRITTEANIANMRRQLKQFGLSYDWQREIATTSPNYYKWTQWIFLKLYQSWFDPDENKAKPLTTLVEKLASHVYAIDESFNLVRTESSPSAKTRSWDQLSLSERANVLDHHRLAYLAEVPVNWCPALGTVLANEEVTNEGRSERGNHPVFRRPLKQWMLRITAYAERLLESLTDLDWPEAIKLMQENWIGKSEGAVVRFKLADSKSSQTIDIFTTRPDTLFGATYMVLAPEHPLVDEITTKPQRDAVETYRRSALQKQERDRQAQTKEKTGVFTGAFAINPVNHERIPIWIADYVLWGYGTGAIMAVPAHDQRDFEFAQTFDLPIKAVVDPDDAWLVEHATHAGIAETERHLEAVRALYRREPQRFPLAFSGVGNNIASAHASLDVNGLDTKTAQARIVKWLEAEQFGYRRIQYKLRDWLFSRQRYWGEPFPILHGPDGEVRAVEETALPVTLPEMDDFKPVTGNTVDATPQTALSRAPATWKNITIDGKIFTREMNTMPQWAGSCWYYLRYIDPHNAYALVDPAKERYWMGTQGVDLYVGGAEHAVLHLLYARFWHQALYDLGVVSTKEPFGRLFNQGYILAHAYTDSRGAYVPAEEVVEKEGRYFYRDQPVTQSFGKMGKSLKNSVNPDDMFHDFGCDTLRLYEMYLGPLDVSKPWNTRDIIGVHRFLQRVWRNFIDETTGTLNVTDDPAPAPLRKSIHKTIKKVSDDFDRLRFNTAIAGLIELNNELVALPKIPREVAEPFVLMLSPIAPHVCEELWERLGHSRSLAYERWPSYDAALLVEDKLEVVVQINGKTRGKLIVPVQADEASIRDLVLVDEQLKKHIDGKTLRKVIYVKGRLVNLVIG